MTDWRVLTPDGPRVYEKNWMPMAAGEQLRFIYACHPTRIVDDRARTVSVSPLKIQAEQFRGGSQAVAFEGGWLSLIHEVRHRDAGGRDRIYIHRFIHLDTDGVMRSISLPFYFETVGVEFAAGLAWHPDGKRLIISYGTGDREAWIATVDAAEVQALLFSIPT